jgi:predicted CXXCH cytochrome family protein
MGLDEHEYGATPRTDKSRRCVPMRDGLGSGVVRVPFALPLALAALLGACHGTGSSRAAEDSPPGGSPPRSNILRADYAGSEACAGCHEKEFAAWSRSAMHRMTRAAVGAEIQAPFDGGTFRFKADSAVFERLGQGPALRVRSSSGERLYRITKLLGGRYREDFVGVEVDPAAPDGPARDHERVLPVSFLRWNGQWRYKGYSVLVTERPGLEPGVVWKSTCMFCHNSVPHFTTLFDELSSAEHVSYQGSASEELPVQRAFRYAVSDEDGLRSALADEVHRLDAAIQGEGLEALLASAARQTRERFDESDLLELGIGCETCHGGSREHVREPLRVRPTFALRSDFIQVADAGGHTPSAAEDVNRTCAKCHTVLFSRYPYTWEGATRRNDPGGSTINSGEARDFLLGACSSELSCADCHDAHGGDRRERLDEFGTTTGNRLCVRCHESLASPRALQAHSHHPPDSVGSACANCHMPKKNMGLGYELTRYHRIGSATEARRVEGDRPLECALCHADRNVSQIVETMERWWGKRYDRAALRKLYGHDLRVDVLRTTLIGGKPHERATAAIAAADGGRKDLLPALVLALDDDYPLVRHYVHHAIERLAGEPVPLAMDATGAEIVAQAQRWLDARGTD